MTAHTSVIADPAAAPDSVAPGPLRRLAGHSLIYGVGGLLVRSLGILLLPLYTQVLTPESYGVIAVSTTLAALLGVIYPLGLHGALPRLYFDVTDRRDRDAAVWTLFLATAALAGTFALLLEFIGPFLFARVFRDVPYSPYLRLAVWTACFSTITLVPLGVLQVQERSRWYLAATSAAALLTAASIIALAVVRGEGAHGYLKGLLIASVLLAAGHVVLTAKVARIGFRRDVIRAALLYSLPLVPHGVAGWALGLSDRAILERYVSLDALGVYALGAQLAGVMTLVATSINTAWVPMLFRTDAERGAQAWPEIARLVTYYVAVLAWIAAALILLLRPALLMVTTAAYHGAYPVIPWLVTGALFNGLYFIPANLLFLRSRTGWLPIITLSAGVVSIGVNLMLAPIYGIQAAAWANCLAYFVMLVVAWAVARRVVQVPVEYARVGRILIASAAIVLVGSVMTLDSPAAEIAVRGAVCIAFPALLYAAGFFTPAERAHIRTLARGIGTRVGAGR